MKKDAVLFVAHSHGVGLVYHYAQLAIALRQVGTDSDVRVAVASTPEEQNPGLWAAVRHAYSSEDIFLLDETPESLASTVDVLLGQHRRLIVHVSGFRHFRPIWSLKKRYPDRLRVVITLMSFQHGNWRRVPLTLLYSCLYRKYVDFVNFLTPYTARRFLGSPGLLAGGRAGFLPCGLEPWGDEAQAPPEKGALSPEALGCLEDDKCFNFLYLAQFHRHKGHRWLLEGMHPVLRKYPNARLLLLGEGVMRSAIISYARSLGVEEQVICPGRVDRNLVPWIMSRSHVGLIGTDTETFGFNYIEPMAAGLPVLGTRTGVGEWIVQDYFTGIGVRQGDCEGLGRGAKFLLANPEMAKKMGDNARDLVRTHLTWPKVADAHLRLYKRLLESEQESH